MRRLLPIRLRELLAQEAAVVRNTAALTVIQVCNYAIPLVTLPYLIRTLGMENFGAVAFATSFIQYFIILTDYGFNISATREVSVHRADTERVPTIFSAVLAVRLAFLLLSAAVCIAGCALVPVLRAHSALVLFAFGSVAANALSLTWFFQGMERMGYITILNLANRLAYLAGLFVFVHGPGDLVRVPALSSCTEMGAAVAGIVLVTRRFGVRPSLPTLEGIRSQLRQGWHVFASTVAISAYTATRTFAIGVFTDPRTTGFYSLAEKLATVAQMFPLAPLLAALYPRLSSLYARHPRATLRSMMRLQRYTTLALAASLPLLALGAPLVVHLLAKQAFGETVLAFRILLISVFFTNANAFRIQFLLVSGAQALYARIHGAAGILGSVLVVAATARMGYLGPPIAMVAINVGIFACTVAAISRKPAQPAWRPMGRVPSPARSLND